MQKRLTELTNRFIMIVCTTMRFMHIFTNFKRLLIDKIRSKPPENVR